MVKVSKKSGRLVDELTPIISESMGNRSGEVFYKFYEYEDDEEVMAGAKSLLYELIVNMAMGSCFIPFILLIWKKCDM